MAHDPNKGPLTYKQEYDGFLQELRQFHINRGTPFRRVAQVSGQPVDLYRLYRRVISLGGWKKVTSRECWDDIVEEFKIPRSCANGTTALKQIYIRYLDLYERVNFFGEDPNLPGNREDEEKIPSKRKVSANVIHGVPLVYNHSQHIIPKPARIHCGLSCSVIDHWSEYEKLEKALLSGLPNEVDFALNVCTLLSSEGKHVLQLNQCSHLLTLMLAHVGIFSQGGDQLITLYEEGWRKLVDRNFIQFWFNSVNDSEIQNLIVPDVYKDQFEQYTQDMMDHELFNIGRVIGMDDAEGQRVLQMAVILRNLSFEAENCKFMARCALVFRFLILCSYSKYDCIRQLGLDTLGNLSSQIVLVNVQEAKTKLMLKIISKCLLSPDKYEVVRGLEILGKICQVDDNEDVLTESISQNLYDSIVRLLLVNDIQLIVYSLETLYQLSELGAVTSTHIASVKSAVDILVNLITVEAQSYGPQSLIGIKVVEYVAPGCQPEPMHTSTGRPPAAAALASLPPPGGTPGPGKATSNTPGGGSTQKSAASKTSKTMPPPSRHSPAPQQAKQRAAATSSPATKPPIVCDNESFVCNWVSGNYELIEGKEVTQAQLLNEYLAFCRRVPLKTTVMPDMFLDCIRVVFGDVPQRSVVQSDGSKEVYLIGVGKRPVPLPICLPQNIGITGQQHRPHKRRMHQHISSVTPPVSSGMHVPIALSPSQSTPSNSTVTQRTSPLRQRLSEPPRITIPHCSYVIHAGSPPNPDPYSSPVQSQSSPQPRTSSPVPTNTSKSTNSHTVGSMSNIQQALKDDSNSGSSLKKSARKRPQSATASPIHESTPKKAPNSTMVKTLLAKKLKHNKSQKDSPKSVTIVAPLSQAVPEHLQFAKRSAAPQQNLQEASPLTADRIPECIPSTPEVSGSWHAGFNSPLPPSSEHVNSDMSDIHQYEPKQPIQDMHTVRHTVPDPSEFLQQQLGSACTEQNSTAVIPGISTMPLPSVSSPQSQSDTSSIDNKRPMSDIVVSKSIDAGLTSAVLPSALHSPQSNIPVDGVEESWSHDSACISPVTSSSVPRDDMEFGSHTEDANLLEKENVEEMPIDTEHSLVSDDTCSNNNNQTEIVLPSSSSSSISDVTSSNMVVNRVSKYDTTNDPLADDVSESIVLQYSCDTTEDSSHHNNTDDKMLYEPTNNISICDSTVSNLPMCDSMSIVKEHTEITDNTSICGEQTIVESNASVLEGSSDSTRITEKSQLPGMDSFACISLAESVNTNSEEDSRSDPLPADEDSQSHEQDIYSSNSQANVKSSFTMNKPILSHVVNGCTDESSHDSDMSDFPPSPLVSQTHPIPLTNGKHHSHVVDEKSNKNLTSVAKIVKNLQNKNGIIHRSSDLFNTDIESIIPLAGKNMDITVCPVSTDSVLSGSISDPDKHVDPDKRVPVNGDIVNCSRSPDSSTIIQTHDKKNPETNVVEFNVVTVENDSNKTDLGFLLNSDSTTHDETSNVHNNNNSVSRSDRAEVSSSEYYNSDASIANDEHNVTDDNSTDKLVESAVVPGTLCEDNNNIDEAVEVGTVFQSEDSCSLNEKMEVDNNIAYSRTDHSLAIEPTENGEMVNMCMDEDDYSMCVAETETAVTVLLNKSEDDIAVENLIASELVDNSVDSAAVTARRSAMVLSTHAEKVELDIAEDMSSTCEDTNLPSPADFLDEVKLEFSNDSDVDSSVKYTGENSCQNNYPSLGEDKHMESSASSVSSSPSSSLSAFTVHHHPSAPVPSTSSSVIVSESQPISVISQASSLTSMPLTTTTTTNTNAAMSLGVPTSSTISLPIGATIFITTNSGQTQASLISQQQTVFPQQQVIMPQPQLQQQQMTISQPLILPQQQVILPQQHVMLPQQQVIMPQQQLSLPQQHVLLSQQQMSLTPQQVVLSQQPVVSLPHQPLTVTAQSVSLPTQQQVIIPQQQVTLTQQPVVLPQRQIGVTQQQVSIAQQPRQQVPSIQAHGLQAIAPRPSTASSLGPAITPKPSPVLVTAIKSPPKPKTHSKKPAAISNKGAVVKARKTSVDKTPIVSPTETGSNAKQAKSEGGSSRCSSVSGVELMCEWNGCKKLFETARHVFSHVYSCHTPVDSDNNICKWEGCEKLERRYLSLITHMQDHHCTEMALRGAAQRRAQAAAAAEAAAANPNNSAPPAPAPAIPAAMVYPPDAAIQAIRRFTCRQPYQELTEPREGPVTKHIRLTSALILRNLARYSAIGRSCIKQHERRISYTALSAVESSGALSNCIWAALHDH